MKLPKDMVQGIERFLEESPPGAIQRGRSYFASGNVLELECVRENHLYAAVVRGGEDYNVGLEFAEGEWASECSCPVALDCKHIVAAMLELQKRAAANGNPTPSYRQRIAQAARSAGRD